MEPKDVVAAFQKTAQGDEISPEDIALVEKSFKNVKTRDFSGKGKAIVATASSNGLAFFPPGTAARKSSSSTGGFWQVWHVEDGNASLTGKPPVFRFQAPNLSTAITWAKSHLEDFQDLASIMR